MMRSSSDRKLYFYTNALKLKEMMMHVLFLAQWLKLNFELTYFVCVFVLSLGGAGISLRRRHATFVESPSEASRRPALA